MDKTLRSVFFCQTPIRMLVKEKEGGGPSEWGDGTRGQQESGQWFAERKTGQHGNIWRAPVRSKVSHDVTPKKASRTWDILYLQHSLWCVAFKKGGCFCLHREGLHTSLYTLLQKPGTHRNHTSIQALSLEVLISLSLNGIQAHRFCERPREDSIVIRGKDYCYQTYWPLLRTWDGLD